VCFQQVTAGVLLFGEISKAAPLIVGEGQLCELISSGVDARGAVVRLLNPIFAHP